MTKDSPKGAFCGDALLASGTLRVMDESDNPFHITQEMAECISACTPNNHDEQRDKLAQLITEQNNSKLIQFLTDQNNLYQVSAEDLAEHYLRQYPTEPWYAPAGSKPVPEYGHDSEKFVHVGDNKYKHRDNEASVDKKNMQGYQLYLNGEPYDHEVLEVETDDTRLRARIRQGVIDDLRQRWGGNTTEALDNTSHVVQITAEEVADQAMSQHFERGLAELNQPFSKRPAEDDVRTIYGASASDMNGALSLDDTGQQEQMLGRTWRAEHILPRKSKTVHKPVRKVTLREKARAQRRARKRSR